MILKPRDDLQIPSLQDYGIDNITGFLPNPPPLRRLPSEFSTWESIMDNLNSLIMTCKLREKVNQLQSISIDILTSKAEQRRAFVVLTFIAHGYMYGVPNADPIICILPRAISIPWFNLATNLNINPVVSYATTALWNWYLIDPDEPIGLRFEIFPKSSNLASLNTFSGSYDESWFYTVPLSIELAGATAVNAILDTQRATIRNDTAVIEKSLTTIANVIETMIGLLKRMYERCDPVVFWRRIRPYSGGSKNSESFPNGVFYEGVEQIDRFVVNDILPPSGLRGTWRKYPGASAGQSPLIHSLDVALGVEHKPVRDNVNPMIEMRESLPSEFQEFIKALAKSPSIRDYCISSLNEKIISEFNRCTMGLKGFRDLHIQIATQYIVLQRKSSNAIVGTGGTDLVPFLKQSREETENAAII